MVEEEGDDIEREKGCFSLRRKRMGSKGKGLFACIDIVFFFLGVDDNGEAKGHKQESKAWRQG